jgi:hypothetical protein
MAKFRPSDWTAVNWYMKEHNYTIKDMTVWPFIRLRDKSNNVVDVNIDNIKSKYKNRSKAKNKKTAA